MDRFDLENLIEVGVREEYQVKSGRYLQPWGTLMVRYKIDFVKILETISKSELNRVYISTI
jgi:hypothetical protein